MNWSTSTKWPGRQLLLERAAGRHRHEVGHARALQRVDVGAEVDRRRRHLVAAAVARQEADRQSVELGEQDLVGGRAPGRLAHPPSARPSARGCRRARCRPRCRARSWSWWFLPQACAAAIAPPSTDGASARAVREGQSAQLIGHARRPAQRTRAARDRLPEARAAGRRGYVLACAVSVMRVAIISSICRCLRLAFQTLWISKGSS